MSNETFEAYADRAVAIIGMTGRFPGANDLATYWRNLRDGVESIARLSDAELLADGVDPDELSDPNYVKAAPVLDRIEEFDAAFFGYSPAEAKLADPQQRLLMECAWEALEQAGYNPETYPETVGVYLGARTNTYVLNIFSNPHLRKSVGIFQLAVGNDLSSLATRISYKLNLHGPSLGVHAACATALVTVHLACQSLLTNECQMALAGAVAIDVPQRTGYLYQSGGILSPDGHCRPFDAGAAGTIFGNGGGVVVLKRLDNALRDGDTIRAVIRSSAVNNDGAHKASFTAPSIEGQTEVILAALAEAEVHPETISYIETHGTGTPLGDPIEVRALTKAFRRSTDRRQFCAIGSVKPNVGHLDAAAGMAGLLKAALAMEHGQLPPSLHFETPNPQIDFAGSPFFVNSALSDWPRGDAPRRAGVSAFGFGGTNAHVILEEAPPLPPSDAGRPWQVLPLSARTPAALAQAAQNLAAHLREHPGANLADVAYTLQVGRKAFEQRRAVVARDAADALAVLEGADPQRLLGDSAAQAAPSVVFLFPGQGSQHAGMAAGLYAGEPVFRTWLDRCAELLAPHLGLDIRDLLYPDERRTTNDERPRGLTNDERRTTDDQQAASITRTTGSGSSTILNSQFSILNSTEYAQPALFAVEYALAQLWMSWGVRPAALLGHSVGEYVAATLAGVFALEDALALVAERGRLMQGLPAGAMLAVPLPEAELLPLLGSDLDLAAVNGPRDCVAAGPPEAVAALAETLAARGVQSRRLYTSHAFHSQMMEPAVAPFAARVALAARRAPRLPVVSNLTGAWLTDEQAADPRYWAEHLRRAVRFADGVATLLEEDGRVLLEVGPGTALSTFVRRCAPAATAFGTLGHPTDTRPADLVAQAALARLWLAGAAVDWERFHAGEWRRRVPLPTYPFERQRYWIDRGNLWQQAAAQRATPEKKADLSGWFYVPSWQDAPLAPAAAPAERRAWLVFADECGLADALAERLEADGQDVLRVAPGREFAQAGPRSFTLDPRRPEDYDRLVRAARDLELPPAAVVHAWSVTADPGPAASPERFAEAQDRGFYSLVYLTQALARARLHGPLQISLLANSTQQVRSVEPVCPAKVTALGPCLVIPQEQPSVSCRSIDIDLPERGTPARARLVAALLDELRAPAPGAAVAYRSGLRLTQTYAPAPEPRAGQTPLRQGGVYLITGGLGSLGLLLGGHLARTCKARLVLVGRTPLPPRHQWGRWIAERGEQDPVSRKLLGVMALEAEGAEVLALDAEVSDPDQMRAVAARARAEFGAIHGVLHAAGLTRKEDFEPVQSIDRAVCERHFRSKPLGLLALEQALADDPPELWVLFSSLASVLGGLGYVAYSAANFSLDAAARAARPGEPAWISVNWDSWLEGADINGMGATLVDLAISPREGLAAFDRSLALGLPQVVVSTGDLKLRMDQWVRRESLAPRGALHARPSLATAYVAPRDADEERIAQVWGEVLGIEQIGIHDSFFDLGGDSLTATQVMARLRDVVGQDLSLRDFFEQPTIAGVVQLQAKLRAEQAERSALDVLARLQQLSPEQLDAELHKRGLASSDEPHALHDAALAGS